MLANKILSACGAADEKLYADDAFSSYLRTGAGADVTVNTGIDMTKGYMLWSKSRSAATDHAVYDSARGVTYDLVTNSTAAQTAQSTGLKAVSSTGHTIGSLAKMNTSGATYVDFVFRKAPKFFDVVTYTGNGSGSQTISHSLGAKPGFILIKNTGATEDWFVWHRKNGSTAVTGLPINLTDAAGFDSSAHNITSTSSIPLGNINKKTGDGSNPIINGNNYVAYLFAHDTGADGLIQCGSFTTDASGNATVNTIGCEPQWGMFKASSGTGDWLMLDQMRGWNMTANDAKLAANTSAAEVTTTEYGNPTATGFEFKGGSASTTYIYMVIRRPNKPPTTGTQVFALNNSTSGGPDWIGGSSGYRPEFCDLAVLASREGYTKNFTFADRLRGFQGSTTSIIDTSTTPSLITSSTAAETTTGGAIYQLSSSVLTGVVYGTNVYGTNRLSYSFKRAPGFMDIVCWKGTGVAGGVRQIAHNLGVMPELTISKERSGNIRSWAVSYKSGAERKRLNLEDNSAAATSGFWVDAFPTSSTFDEYFAFASQLTSTCVTYLFASIPGISKIGTYTGNGSSQTINCGFAAGARFILIKRTDSTGNWIVADSSRGIVSGNDPALYLNSSAAEVTGVDWCDPDPSGFIINQESTMNANVNGATYIFLAIS